jgi:hypothetical protein
MLLVLGFYFPPASVTTYDETVWLAERGIFHIAPKSSVLELSHGKIFSAEMKGNTINVLVSPDAMVSGKPKLPSRIKLIDGEINIVIRHK